MKTLTLVISGENFFILIKLTYFLHFHWPPPPLTLLNHHSLLFLRQTFFCNLSIYSS